MSRLLGAHCPEAPASSSSPNLKPETCNEELDASSNRSNGSNPSSPDPTLTPSPSTTSSTTSPSPNLEPGTSNLEPKPQSKIPNPKSKIPSPPARRLAHHRQLEHLKEAPRHGRPYHFVL